MIRKVLIANRGEIAMRIARTCRELGIATVVAHSSADRDSAAVRFADESVQIGPGPAKSSYLYVPSLIEAAKATRADAIHPGYGFLSENADFATVCEEEGIIFVGAPAEVMNLLGDKASARSMMTEAGLPLLPGSKEALSGPAAAALANEIGYPVIMKAVAGGGGRGMAVVRDPADFSTAWEQTRSTAQAIFRDGRLYVERYLDSARHVEIQILADGHGNVIHLGSRDCSVQRRHQKLIEEAPAPQLPADLLDEMGAAAVRGAKAAGYVGAGTFEFLVDQSHRYYFMEVNCRIQVEHPVTEMVTGIDLIAEQLHIAAGRPLSFGQWDVQLRGVSLECRINAENPLRDFVPAPGVLTECSLPGGPFVRVDTHVAPGYSIPPFYDSLLAKVIVWAPDRDGAIDRMRRALAEIRISGRGVATTADFLRGVLESERFRAVQHDTRFLEKRELP